MPLCPWFELGLVDGDVSSDSDEDEGMDSSEKRELQHKCEQQEERETGTSQTVQNDDESDACKLLKGLKASSIRTSAFKIMTKVSYLIHFYFDDSRACH